MRFNRKERDHIRRLQDRRDILKARINDSNELLLAKAAREWVKEYEAVDWAIKALYAAEDSSKETK